MPKRSREGRGAPPWWPEDEAWPPSGITRFGARRRFLIIIGALGGMFLLLMTCGWFVAGRSVSQDPGGPNENGGGWHPQPFFAIVIFGIGAFLLVRFLRRTAEPIADVMEAAERVASGDYTARVQPRGGRDVRKLATTFNQMTERIAANEDQRRRLLADVAHELRTPLSVIRGNVEAMIDGVHPRDDAHLGPIVDETRQMARLLDDLQTLANADAGALKLHKERIDLAALVSDTMTAFGARAAERAVVLRTVAPEPEWVEIDLFRIRQVLDNVLANALRWTPSGGSIVASVFHRDNAAGFSIRDTGPGMTPENLTHMFERFTKSADSGGSGLGLAIARGIVAAHDGTIEASSLPSGGLTITVSLPR